MDVNKIIQIQIIEIEITKTMQNRDLEFFFNPFYKIFLEWPLNGTKKTPA